ncbi:MAG TPA: hypothetical protein VHM70_10960 [Polyangiaceae bacterium]|nr:hypothetical protein [Polyangiaceae bacterium]
MLPGPPAAPEPVEGVVVEGVPPELLLLGAPWASPVLLVAGGGVVDGFTPPPGCIAGLVLGALLEFVGLPGVVVGLDAAFGVDDPPDG